MGLAGGRLGLDRDGCTVGLGAWDARANLTCLNGHAFAA